MASFIIRRLLLLIPVLLGVSIVVFVLIRLIPGDAALLAIGVDQRVTPEIRELVRKSYGLDQPQPVQYLRWMEHVLQGDLGTSLRTRRSVNEELGLRLPVTVELAVLAALIGTLPAVAAGVIAAVRRNSALDYAATVATLLGISVPNFLLAILLVLVFCLWLRWLPPIGYVELTKDPIGNLRTMILPAVSLSLPLAAVLMRNTRSAVLEVLEPGARARGSRQRVAGRADPRPPRHPQRRLADSDRRRHSGGQPARGHGHHRDDLRPARGRSLHLRGDLQPRLSGRAGRHAGHRHHLRRRQHDGRRALRGPRSPPAHAAVG